MLTKSQPKLKLTKRQQQILFYLLKGMSNAEVSRHLDVSEHTIKAHLWRMFKKFKVANRVQLVNFAISKKLYTIPTISDIELLIAWSEVGCSTPSADILLYGKRIIDMANQNILYKLFSSEN